MSEQFNIEKTDAFTDADLDLDFFAEEMAENTQKAQPAVDVDTLFYIQQQLDNLQLDIKDIQRSFKKSGLLHNITQEHKKALQQQNNQFIERLNDSMQRLDQISTHAIDSINEAVQAFPVQEFKQLTQKSCANIQQTTKYAVNSIAKKSNYWHLKNLLFICGFCLVINFAVLGGYLYVSKHYLKPTEHRAKIEFQSTLQPKNGRLIDYGYMP